MTPDFTVLAAASRSDHARHGAARACVAQAFASLATGAAFSRLAGK